MFILAVFVDIVSLFGYLRINLETR